MLIINLFSIINVFSYVSLFARYLSSFDDDDSRYKL